MKKLHLKIYYYAEKDQFCLVNKGTIFYPRSEHIKKPLLVGKITKCKLKEYFNYMAVF